MLAAINTMEAFLVITGGALAFIIVLLVMSTRWENDETELRRSNARVVKEVKRIALHEPRKLYEVRDQERNP